MRIGLVESRVNCLRSRTLTLVSTTTLFNPKRWVCVLRVGRFPLPLSVVYPFVVHQWI